MNTIDDDYVEWDRYNLRKAEVICSTADITIGEIIDLIGKSAIIGVTEDMLDKHLIHISDNKTVRIVVDGKAVEIIKSKDYKTPRICFDTDAWWRATKIEDMPDPVENIMFLVDETDSIYWSKFHPNAQRNDLVICPGYAIVPPGHRGAIAMTDHLYTGTILKDYVDGKLEQFRQIDWTNIPFTMDAAKSVD